MPLKLTQTHQCAQCYGCDAEIKHRQPVSTCAPTHTHIHICTHTHTHTHTNAPGDVVCDAERKHRWPAFYEHTHIHTYTHTHIQMCQANFYVMLKESTACLLSTHKRQTQTKTQVQTHLFDNTLSHTHTQTSLAMMNAQASTFKHTHTHPHSHCENTQWNTHILSYLRRMGRRHVSKFLCACAMSADSHMDPLLWHSWSKRYLSFAHNVHTSSIVIWFQSSLHQRTRIQHIDVLK